MRFSIVVLTTPYMLTVHTLKATGSTTSTITCKISSVVETAGAKAHRKQGIVFPTKYNWPFKKEYSLTIHEI